MPLVNLTKQPLQLHDTSGARVEIPPDPRHVGLVSVGEHSTFRDTSGHEFSLNVQRVRGVKGMPDPAPDTLYVVPFEIAVVLQEERDDVVYLAEDATVRVGENGARRISHLRRLISSQN